MSWDVWGVPTTSTTPPYQGKDLGGETPLSTSESHGALTLAFLCSKDSK